MLTGQRPWQDIGVTEEISLSPDDGPYEWFVQASRLLDDGRSPEAADLFAQVVAADPSSRSAWEGLARARFDSQEYEQAAQAFTRLVEIAPDEDYAHFGLGLCLWRLRQFPQARDHLGMAVVMRPNRADYASALGQVKISEQRLRHHWLS